MSEPAHAGDEPSILGVPPGTPEAVRPSTTGVVVGPVDEEPEAHPAQRDPADETSVEQTLEDAEGGIEGSLLDAPEDGTGVA